MRSCLDIRMVHLSMANDSRVADEVYIKRGCLVLQDFLVFSLYWFSCIAKQARLWPSLDYCPVLILSIWTLKRFVLITISHYCYQYHLRPTPPITPCHPPHQWLSVSRWIFHLINYPATLLVVSVEGHYGGEEESRMESRPQEQNEWGSMTYSTATDRP